MSKFVRKQNAQSVQNSSAYKGKKSDANWSSSGKAAPDINVAKGKKESKAMRTPKGGAGFKFADCSNV